MKKNLVLLLCLLVACAPATSAPTQLPTPTRIPPTQTSTPMPAAFWISPAVPTALRDSTADWDIPRTASESSATLKLAPGGSGDSTWVYALVAPFATVQDGATLDELLQVWRGQGGGPRDAYGRTPFAGRPLMMAESTRAAFTSLWGEPASGAVRIEDEGALLDLAWGDMPSWAIIPFEDIQPRWKVLTVDGQSPIRNDFNLGKYPLQVKFSLQGDSTSGFKIQTSNRDPHKLTTLLLTGTTAMVDATAVAMEKKGATYIGRNIRDWARGADIFHISNEVAFDKDCPYPNFGNTNLSILCSRPGYFDLLTDLGTDVIELTGEHFNNRGTAAMLSTLQTYRDAGIPYYGGGANLAESRKPLYMEHNGNKFMFLGCNMKGNYKSAQATATMPGAAPCDFAYLTEQIRNARAQGILPIFTFQDYEYYSPEIRPGELYDFRTMADAGAVLVSGSQGHYPQVMEFYKGVFIHYALGNLFYDQMSYVSPDGTYTTRTRWEFLDRHVFYDGRYLGTELLTAMLEEYSAPRPMTPAERYVFLDEYFAYSGWTTQSPTPMPSPTPSLTPMWLPTFADTPPYPYLPTYTPTPTP